MRGLTARRHRLRRDAEVDEREDGMHESQHTPGVASAADVASAPDEATTRPAFHFTPRSGWINDPHGITWRDDHYEAFYQCVPDSVHWTPNCHWGHARGADLLSLTELPVAMAPGDGDDGVWTGSVVVDGSGTARAFYTTINTPDWGIGRIRVAEPRDDAWIEWTKGPVVAEPPPGLDVVSYRDPFIRAEGAGWRMFVGASSSDGTAMALSYVSDDLDSWRYDGVVFSRSTRETEPLWMGVLWECPQVFQVGDRFAMVSSVWDADPYYAAYALGDYRDGRFEPHAWGRLSYGDSYYAPSVFHDRLGRPCLTYWMRGIGGPDVGWAGAHSVPHLLEVRGDTLVATVHPDLDRYRSEPVEATAVDGQAADLSWRPEPGDRLTLSRGGQLVATLQHAGADLLLNRGGAVTAMPATDQVRILVDGPVLEISGATGMMGAALACPAGPLRVAASGRLETRILAR